MNDKSEHGGNQGHGEDFFFYLETKIDPPKSTMTGAEIKQAIRAVVPTFDMTHNLVLEGHGNTQDEIIPDDKVVDLSHKHGGPKHFFSKPPTNFG